MFPVFLHEMRFFFYVGILLSHYNFEVTETADSGQCVEQGIIIGDCLVGIEGETLASLQINSVDEFISEVVARPKPCTLNFNAINVKADSPYKVSRRELDADKYVEKNLHKRNEPMPLSAFIVSKHDRLFWLTSKKH